jgi:phospholipid transport system substrate-binding protein
MREFPMSRITRFFLLVVSVFSLFVTTSAFAADDGAELFVRSKHEQLTAVLKQPKSATREKKVTAAIDESFDYATLAERSLGDEWKNRSEDERKQFRELLEGLVRQSYRKSIDSTLGWDVEYRGKTVKDTGTVVATVSKNKKDSRKAPVTVDYVLLQSGGKWRVVDVIIEGSSLVNNYRSQFTKVIKKKGFNELITKMKSKLGKGEG